MKAISLIKSSLLALVVAAAGAPSEGASIGTCAKQFYVSNSPDFAFRKDFLQNARFYLDRLDLRGETISFKTTSGQSFDVKGLSQELINICVVRGANLFGTKGYGKDVSCSSRYVGQWVTRKDSGVNTPIVGISLLGTDVSVGPAEAPGLYLHESLGSLGYTDDEYQISAALMALDAMKDWSQPLARHLLASFKKIHTHTSAPTYKSTSSEGCYKWARDKMTGNPTVGTLLTPQEMKRAGGTHIGGAGDPSSQILKANVLFNARDYWEQKRVAGADEKDFEIFVNELLDFGIEALDEFANYGKQIYPVVVVFAKSKRQYADRPRKDAAYLYTQAIREDQKTAWPQGIRHILDHVYCTQMHKSKGCTIDPVDKMGLGFLRNGIPK